MRLKITRALSGRFDGVQLGTFVVGQVYEVGGSVAAFLVSARAAIPVPQVEAR